MNEYFFNSDIFLFAVIIWVYIQCDCLGLVFVLIAWFPERFSGSIRQTTNYSSMWWRNNIQTRSNIFQWFQDGPHLEKTVAWTRVGQSAGLQTIRIFSLSISQWTMASKYFFSVSDNPTFLSPDFWQNMFSFWLVLHLFPTSFYLVCK